MRWGKQCFAILLKLLRKLEAAAAMPILLRAPFLPTAYVVLTRETGFKSEKFDGQAD
jgi:hypothetical protein